MYLFLDYFFIIIIICTLSMLLIESTTMTRVWQVPDDFDGESDLEREYARRDVWRRNLWADVMSTTKYPPHFFSKKI